MVVSAPLDPEPDLTRAEAGLPEEVDEAQHLAQAAAPTSEEPQAPAWEQGQSIDRHLSVLEEPTSKPGRESETPEEVSEPDQRVPRNLEIRFQASARRDRLGEKLFPSLAAYR